MAAKLPDFDAGVSYWANTEASVNGVLGGYGPATSVPRLDAASSRMLILSMLPALSTITPPHKTGAPAVLDASPSRSPKRSFRALDCGAGIGRVTQSVLLPLFHRIDLVEPVEKFVAEAQRGAGLKREGWKLLGGEGAQAKGVRMWLAGLQYFDPRRPAVPLEGGNSRLVATVGSEALKWTDPEIEVELEDGYDLVMIQWCIGHLSDEQLVAFLQRAHAALRRTNGELEGYIILKENCCADDSTDGAGVIFDDDDSSITRSDKVFRKVFADAGLNIIRREVQKGFPKELFPVVSPPSPKAPLSISLDFSSRSSLALSPSRLNAPFPPVDLDFAPFVSVSDWVQSIKNELDPPVDRPPTPIETDSERQRAVVATVEQHHSWDSPEAILLRSHLASTSHTSNTTSSTKKSMKKRPLPPQGSSFGKGGGVAYWTDDAQRARARMNEARVTREAKAAVSQSATTEEVGSRKAMAVHPDRLRSVPNASTSSTLAGSTSARPAPARSKPASPTKPTKPVSPPVAKPAAPTLASRMSDEGSNASPPTPWDQYQWERVKSSEKSVSVAPQWANGRSDFSAKNKFRPPSPKLGYNSRPPPSIPPPGIPPPGLTRPPAPTYGWPTSAPPAPPAPKPAPPFKQPTFASAAAGAIAATQWPPLVRPSAPRTQPPSQPSPTAQAKIPPPVLPQPTYIPAPAPGVAPTLRPVVAPAPAAPVIAPASASVTAPTRPAPPTHTSPILLPQPTQTIRGPPVAVPAPTPVVATPVGGGGAATSSVSSGWGGGSISGVSSAVGASTSSRVPAAAKSEVAPSVASSTAVASGSGLSQSGRLNLDEIATTLKEVELETQAQQPLTKANLDVAHAFKSKLVSVTGVLENSLGSSEFKPTRSAALAEAIIARREKEKTEKLAKVKEKVWDREWDRGKVAVVRSLPFLFGEAVKS